MLVLNRMEGERIVIGDGADAIWVSVERIKGGMVRIGIAAPPHVAIDREEVRAAIEAERQGRAS